MKRVKIDVDGVNYFDMKVYPSTSFVLTERFYEVSDKIRSDIKREYETIGSCSANMGINPTPAWGGVDPCEVRGMEQKKEGDSRSFEDMFLEAHGMKPKKEERIEEIRLRQTSPMPPASVQLEVRTKALELAISHYSEDMHADVILDAADRFYTYITKGE